MTAKLSNLSIRTDPETLGRWKAAAERDRRPLAQWVRIVLDEAAVPADERLAAVVAIQEASYRAQNAQHEAAASGFKPPPYTPRPRQEVQPMFKASKVKP